MMCPRNAESALSILPFRCPGGVLFFLSFEDCLSDRRVVAVGTVLALERIRRGRALRIGVTPFMPSRKRSDSTIRPSE